MTYQWYRVNPVSYEMTAITGATGLTYITTEDDIGYFLMIRATGDDEEISGFIQIMSTAGVLMPNRAYVSNMTNTGFTLNLHKAVSGLTANELSLIDYYGDPVAIKSVTQGANAAIYSVSADLDLAKGPYQLTNDSYFWKIITPMGHGQHFLEGVQIPYSVDRYAIDVLSPEGGLASVGTTPNFEAAAGEIITIYVLNIEAGKKVKPIAVLDEDEEAVATVEVKTGEEYTFIMPAKAVTVKVELEEVISVEPDSMPLNVGSAGQIIVTVNLPGEHEVTWTTSNAAVATVDNDGKVTGVSLGNATITVALESDSSVYKDIEVTVGPDLVVSDGTIKVGDVDPSITLSMTADTFTGAATNSSNWQMTVIGEGPPHNLFEGTGITGATIELVGDPGTAKSIVITFTGTVNVNGTILLGPSESIFTQGYGSYVLQVPIE